MLYLGLDPSLRSYGWCIYDPTKTGLDKLVAKGRWKTNAQQVDPVRYAYLRDSLMSLIKEYDIRYAAMETPPIGQSKSFNKEKLYALAMYNLEAMYRSKVDIVLVAPTQLQLFAKMWGNGVIPGEWFKSDMQDMSRVDLLDLYTYPKHSMYWDQSFTKRHKLRSDGYKNIPVPVVDISTYSKDVRKKLHIQNDEADAYLVSKLAYRYWSFYKSDIKEGDLTPSEWDVFVKRHEYIKGDKKGVVDEDGIIYKKDTRFYCFATDTKYNDSIDIN